MDFVRYSVLTALRSVYDPEVRLDIVTMGLVYGVEVTTDIIHVSMTLTSPGCPLGETIVAMAQEALRAVAGEREVRLDVVWDPPWNPQMISEEGRVSLGVG